MQQANYPRWLVIVTIYDREGAVDTFAGSADVDCENRRSAIRDVIQALPGHSHDPLIQRMIAWSEEGGRCIDIASARIVTTAIEMREGRPHYPDAKRAGRQSAAIFGIRQVLETLERREENDDAE